MHGFAGSLLVYGSRGRTFTYAARTWGKADCGKRALLKVPERVACRIKKADAFVGPAVPADLWP